MNKRHRPQPLPCHVSSSHTHRCNASPQSLSARSPSVLRKTPLPAGFNSVRSRCVVAPSMAPAPLKRAPQVREAADTMPYCGPGNSRRRPRSHGRWGWKTSLQCCVSPRSSSRIVPARSKGRIGGTLRPELRGDQRSRCACRMDNRRACSAGAQTTNGSELENGASETACPVRKEDEDDCFFVIASFASYARQNITNRKKI